MKKIIACISIICYTLLCYSQNQTTDNNYRTQKNISYLHPGEKDSYKLERCKLDLHYPTDKKDSPPYLVPRRRTGSRRKTFSEGVPGARLRRDSRKLPTQPACPKSCLHGRCRRAVAWTFENIEEFGGDKRQNIHSRSFSRWLSLSDAQSGQELPGKVEY